MAAPDSGRTAARRDCKRNDDAAAAADDDAASWEQLAALHDGYSADVAAPVGGGADRLASRRTNPASGSRRDRRTIVGRPRGDALRIALHRRFTAVRGDLVYDRHGARHRYRRAGGIEGIAVLVPRLQGQAFRRGDIGSAAQA